MLAAVEGVIWGESMGAAPPLRKEMYSAESLGSRGAVLVGVAGVRRDLRVRERGEWEENLF